jgi:hypothetical protein
MCYHSHSICAEQPIFANNLRLYSHIDLTAPPAYGDGPLRAATGLLQPPQKVPSVSIWQSEVT